MYNLYAVESNRRASNEYDLKYGESPVIGRQRAHINTHMKSIIVRQIQARVIAKRGMEHFTLLLSTGMFRISKDPKYYTYNEF